MIKSALFSYVRQHIVNRKKSRSQSDRRLTTNPTIATKTVSRKWPISQRHFKLVFEMKETPRTCKDSVKIIKVDLIMKNEIEVRTNKGEYSPGEHICGAVYLRIISPTGGTGVQVKFHGYAKFEYLYKTGERPGYREKMDCIHYPHEKLFHSEEPLSISNKLFPFKIELSKDIPGTFEARGENQLARWKATVEYILEVEVINARELKVRQSIRVLQALKCGCPSRLPPKPTHVVFPVRWLQILPIFIKNVHITARLHDHIHRTGEVIKLRVIITNNSRVPVQSLKIKLLRTTIFMGKPPKLPESELDDNIDASEHALDICVEKNVIVGREQSFEVNSRNELDSILFPLKEADGKPVCPTVKLSLIQCHYQVCVTANLSNGSSFDIYIPVPIVNASKNKQWHNWDAPYWLTEDDMEKVPSDDKCLFRVPDNILCTEAFSTIPGFTPL